MDKLILRELHFIARHGVLPEEHENSQHFSATLELELPLAPAGRSDRLDQTIEMEPNDAEALLLRGRAHLALRHVAPAVADLRAASSRLPNRPDVHYHLALALEAASQRGDALKAAEQALRLAPDFADARSLSERLRR